jgi:hypothetical protein
LAARIFHELTVHCLHENTLDQAAMSEIGHQKRK